MESRPPIVLVVLDELPVSSLLTRAGRSTRALSGFGRLARDATWYPHATTVHPFTVKAVPAILTGDMPTTAICRRSRIIPDNLFTLLGSSYSLLVHEATTRLCPERLCPRTVTSHLESVDVLFDDVRAPYILKVLPDSVTGAGDGAIPPRDGTLAGHVGHAVDGFDDLPRHGSTSDGVVRRAALHARSSPHFPWRYLPSGRSRMPSRPTIIRAVALNWATDPWVVETTLQRHLVQLQYTDVLLGRLLQQAARRSGSTTAPSSSSSPITVRAFASVRDSSGDHREGTSRTSRASRSS